MRGWLVVVVMMVVVSVGASTVGAQTGNLLRNPNFDELQEVNGETLAHRLYGGRAEHAIAHGWEFYFSRPGAGQNAPEANVTGPTGPWAAPVYFPAFRDGATGDQSAQKIFCYYSPCDTGVFQTVAVPAGQQCTFSTTVTQIRSQQAWEYTDIQNYATAGGISNAVYHWVDTSGGRSRANRTTFEGAPVFYMGNDAGAAAFMSRHLDAPVEEIRTYSTTFRASTGQATVGVGFAPDFGYQHQNIWIMAATLTCGGSVAAPAPTPTAAPPPEAVPSPPQAGPPPSGSCAYGSDIRAGEYRAVPLISGLRVRTSPDTASLANWTGRYLPAGVRLRAECVTTTPRGDVWVRVNGQTAQGWVAMRYNGGILACMRGGPGAVGLPSDVPRC